MLNSKFLVTIILLYTRTLHMKTKIYIQAIWSFDIGHVTTQISLKKLFDHEFIRHSYTFNASIPDQTESWFTGFQGKLFWKNLHGIYMQT